MVKQDSINHQLYGRDATHLSLHKKVLKLPYDVAQFFPEFQNYSDADNEVEI